jgi:hypothetical protein
VTRFGVGLQYGLANFDTHCRSISNLGVKEVRLHIPWRDIEPRKGTYEWWNLDGMVSSIRKYGMGVLPLVLRTPAWIGEFNAPPPPDEYARFVADLDGRYGFPAYEIWNEQDWLGCPDWRGTPQQYAAMYRAARAALNSRGKQAIVGGLAYPTGVNWLKTNWRDLGPVDAVGWHPYGLTVDATWALLHQMVDALNQLGSQAPVDVTEVGLNVPPHTEKQRSGYLRVCAEKIKPWKRIRRWNVFWWHIGSGEMSVWDIAHANGTWKGGAAGYARGIAS